MPKPTHMKTLAIFFLPMAMSSSFARGDTLHVAAAISMKESLQQIDKAFEAKTGTSIDLALGASGTLETDIENGADIDVFISAAEKEMDQLAKQRLLDDASRAVIARNALSLITPKDGVAIKGFDDLKSPAVRRVAAGEPKIVPAGDYAKQVLDHLHLSDAIKDKLIFGANVRQVLAYVRQGEVDAGLVYRTDAIEAGNAVTIVADADASWCKPIEYPGAVLAASKHKQQAEAFLAYLRSAEGQAILARHGFVKGDPPLESKKDGASK